MGLSSGNLRISSATSRILVEEATEDPPNFMTMVKRWERAFASEVASPASGFSATAETALSHRTGFRPLLLPSPGDSLQTLEKHAGEAKCRPLTSNLELRSERSRPMMANLELECREPCDVCRLEEGEGCMGREAEAQAGARASPAIFISVFFLCFCCGALHSQIL